MFTLVLALLVGGVWVFQKFCCDDVPRTAKPEVVSASAIDRPAVDRVAPKDAVLDVRTQFGAVGDGLADDTSAIQSAISMAIGLSSSHQVVFLPRGTYRISRPLEWRRPDGTWATSVTLFGENRDLTVIKLADSTPGFGDVTAPRSMIVTGSQNADDTDGSGNQAFNNFISDLTVQIGSANPGANGIDYLANNRGAVRNVVVKAAAGSGYVGIVMARRWPGPALLQDVRVTGFTSGIALTNYQYSMTMENVRLSGQRSEGILNLNNTLAIRGLISDNAVTAVRNGIPGTTAGLLVLVDSQLVGGSVDVPAVDTHSSALLRRVRTDGYGLEISHNGAQQALSPAGDWMSGPAVSAFGAPAAALDLPIADEPADPVVTADRWVTPAHFGGNPDDRIDDTDAVQAALDSGQPVVYLTPGSYRITRPLRVPSTIRMIEGFQAFVDASLVPSASAAANVSIFVVAGAGEPITFSNLNIKSAGGWSNIARDGTRTVVLRDIHFTGRGIPWRGGPGQLFINDVDGGMAWTFTADQQVWARQFNTEQDNVKIKNQGAVLWVLGLKTEGSSTVLDSAAGARTEILGGYLYPAAVVVGDVPAFVTEDAAFSASFVINATDPQHDYPVVVEARCPTGSRTLRERVVGNSSVVLYSHEVCSGS